MTFLLNYYILFIMKNLNLAQSQKAIYLIKDHFQRYLAEELNLLRVSAPLFLKKGSGLNDDLNGIERKVSFKINETELEIVQSLAKWKRYALMKYGFNTYEGLYTDMNAIRMDEKLDYMHSIYVDQWDWELIISKNDRNLEFLKTIVKKINRALVKTNNDLLKAFPNLLKVFNDEVYFISAQELLDKYPNLNPKEREAMITKEHKTVFIFNIGKKLSDGKVHDQRAADYDDWDLNGDLLIYHPTLDKAIELSSMGIRVDSTSLLKQLKILNEEHKKELYYHSLLLNDHLPLTIGGGIGQSRLCMLLLNKKHIGEVQVSYWDEENLKIAESQKLNFM